MECISVLRSTAKLHWIHEEQREAVISNVEPNCGKRKSLFAARRNILQRVRGESAMVKATATVRPSDGPSDEKLCPSATGATERGPASGDERGPAARGSSAKEGCRTTRFGQLF